MLLGLSDSSAMASSLESRSATRGIKCITLKSCGGFGFLVLKLLVDLDLVVSGKPAFTFKGILNYDVIGLIQLKLGNPKVDELPVEQVQELYKENVLFAKNTMLDKNHDYGEAWRDMSQESYADLILMKLMRIRQILNNDGKTIISEGIDANFVDILNYAAFALIQMSEGKH